MEANVTDLLDFVGVQRKLILDLERCDDGMCPVCGGGCTHDDDCELAAVLAVRMDKATPPSSESNRGMELKHLVLKEMLVQLDGDFEICIADIAKALDKRISRVHYAARTLVYECKVAKPGRTFAGAMITDVGRAALVRDA